MTRTHSLSLVFTGLFVVLLLSIGSGFSAEKTELKEKCKSTLNSGLKNLREQKDKNSAIKHFLEAAEIGKQIPSDECRENALLNAVGTQLALERYSEALKTAEQGVEHSSSGNALFPLFHACLFQHYKSKAYEGLGNQKQAEKSIKEFEKTFEKLQAEYEKLSENSKADLRWKGGRLNDILKIAERTGTKIDQSKYSKELERMKKEWSQYSE